MEMLPQQACVITVCVQVLVSEGKKGKYIDRERDSEVR